METGTKFYIGMFLLGSYVIKGLFFFIQKKNKGIKMGLKSY